MEVDPAKLEEAAKTVDDAAAHFQARTDDLADVAIENQGGGKLGGGYGETGGYQRGLSRFWRDFEEILGEFLKDETKFWVFLEGFRDRLRQSAGTYQTTELRNTESLNQIAQRLDSGEG